MLSLCDLAMLEEGRLLRAYSEVSEEHRHVSKERGGGLLARGAPGTWVNAAIALGLDGPTPPDVVDEMIEWFESKGIEPRLEVCPFAHPSLIALLAERRFVVRLFENVFFRELSPDDEFPTPYPIPREVAIRELDVGDSAQVDECARVIASAFAGDVAPTEESLELARTCLRHKHVVTLAAWADGRVVGAGSIEIRDRQSALFGLATAPEFRRRGVQLALIAARLKLAAQRGVTLATIGARPGVATEGNARRMGFQVGYTKVAMVRPGPGLVSVRD